MAASAPFEPPPLVSHINNHQQRLLEARLQRLEHVLQTRLRTIARDKLDVWSEHVRLKEDIKRLRYFNRNIDVTTLKQFNDRTLKLTKQFEKEASRDNFTFNETVSIHRRTSLQASLPVVENGFFVSQKHYQERTRSKQKRPKANKPASVSNMQLVRSKTFSQSDSNLHKLSDVVKNLTSDCNLKDSHMKSVSHEDLRGIPREKTINLRQLLKGRSTTSTDVSTAPPRLVLPAIGPREGSFVTMLGIADERRYLKTHINKTGTSLPPVREDVSRQRKLSV